MNINIPNPFALFGTGLLVNFVILYLSTNISTTFDITAINGMRLNAILNRDTNPN